MKHYYVVSKTFKTYRRFKILAISDENLNGQRIFFDRIDLNSVKFLNIEEDVHIIAYWYDFEYAACIFLVEHESYPQISVGAMPEVYDTKIVNCVRLIKISNKL